MNCLENIMNPCAISLHRTNPDAFRAEYAIMKDKAQIGTVSQRYRPKNAGGTAWCAKIDESAIPGRLKTGSGGMVIYSSTTAKIVEIVHHLVTPGSPAPQHWR